MENLNNIRTETLNVEMAAKMLGIGRQTAYDLASKGELPGALRLGGRIVVSRRLLEAFLDGKNQDERLSGETRSHPS